MCKSIHVVKSCKQNLIENFVKGNVSLFFYIATYVICYFAPDADRMPRLACKYRHEKNFQLLK